MLEDANCNFGAAGSQGHSDHHIELLQNKIQCFQTNENPSVVASDVLAVIVDKYDLLSEIWSEAG